MRAVNEINYARYNRVIADLQEVCKRLEGSVVLPIDEQKGAKDGVVFLMLPKENITLDKARVGAVLPQRCLCDAVFASDEAKVITETKLHPRIRFIVRDVWQDGVKLPLDVMRETFGIED